MAEATHDDIITRVREVERRQERSEIEIRELRAEQRGTHLELIGHREEFAKFQGEITGAVMVVKWGMPILITVGLAIIGLLVSG